MIVISACQDEYTYQKHFKIEKVYMTRISIEDFPTDDAVLYLMEPAFSACPPETVMCYVDIRCKLPFIEAPEAYRTVRGTPPFSGGSIDTISSLTFNDNNGMIVHPIQLHWNVSERDYMLHDRLPNDSHSCNNVDTLNASISLSTEGTTATQDISYLTDYRRLVQRMMGINLHDIRKCRYGNYSCSTSYLFAFSKNSKLPVEGYLRFQKNKSSKKRLIKMEWNDTIVKCKLKGKIHFFRAYADSY